MKCYWQIATVLLAILLYASVKQCRNQLRTSNHVMLAVKDTVVYYKNKLGSQTASITTLQLNKKQLEKLVFNKDAELVKLAKEFSQVKSIIKYKTVMLTDSIQIVYKDTVPCVFKRSGRVNTNWYGFAWQSSEKGVQIDSLQMNTSTTLITGFKRNWFLGRQTVTTDITNTNPYLKTTTIESTEINVPHPWYKKWYIWLIAGVGVGYISAR